MRPTAPHTSLPLTRRRMLHATLRGLTGLAAWQGWPRRQVALAQKGAPTGQMTWALHFTLTPQWFDPAETGGLLTLTIGLYALHDALVKPMPDGPLSPCLATAWHESEDGLRYDFTLREGGSCT
jgi:peptide/nickel transport system substrate-binding protein